MFRRSGRPAWTNQEILDLESEIYRFKEKAKVVFGLYEESCMAKCKRHALNRVVEVLNQVGSVEYLDAGLFEGTHKRFKTQYRNDSRKRGTEMRETLIRKCFSASFDNMRYENRKQKTRKASSTKRVSENGTVPVYKGKSVTVSRLRASQQYTFTLRQLESSEQIVLEYFLLMSQYLEEDGLGALILLLQEETIYSCCS